MTSHAEDRRVSRLRRSGREATPGEPNRPTDRERVYRPRHVRGAAAAGAVAATFGASGRGESVGAADVGAAESPGARGSAALPRPPGIRRTRRRSRSLIGSTWRSTRRFGSGCGSTGRATSGPSLLPPVVQCGRVPRGRGERSLLRICGRDRRIALDRCPLSRAACRPKPWAGRWAGGWGSGGLGSGSTRTSTGKESDEPRSRAEPCLFL